MIEFILQYWIQFAFGIVVVILGYIGKEVHKYFHVINTTKNSVRALLRLHLLEDYDYYLKKGTMTVDEKERVNLLYLEYHNLGEDNVMEEIMEKFSSFPIEPCDTKDAGGE